MHQKFPRKDWVTSLMNALPAILKLVISRNLKKNCYQEIITVETVLTRVGLHRKSQNVWKSKRWGVKRWSQLKTPDRWNHNNQTFKLSQGLSQMVFSRTLTISTSTAKIWMLNSTSLWVNLMHSVCLIRVRRYWSKIQRLYNSLTTLSLLRFGKSAGKTTQRYQSTSSLTINSTSALTFVCKYKVTTSMTKKKQLL